MSIFDGGIQIDDYWGNLLQSDPEGYAYPWSSSENLTSSRIPEDQNGTRNVSLPEPTTGMLVDTRSGVQAQADAVANSVLLDIKGRNREKLNGTNQNQLVRREEQPVVISDADKAKLDRKRKRDRDYRQQIKDGKNKLVETIAELREELQSVKADSKKEIMEKEKEKEKEIMGKKKVEQELRYVKEAFERLHHQQQSQLQIVSKERVGQEVVLRLDMDDSNVKQIAIRVVADFQGIDSIDTDVKGKKLTITGDVDAFDIVCELRKTCSPAVKIESVRKLETMEKKPSSPVGADTVNHVTILRELREVCRSEIVAVKLAGAAKKLTVNGDVDPISLYRELTEVCRTEIVAVRQATEEKKKLMTITNGFDVVSGLKIKDEGKKNLQSQEMVSAELKKLCITKEPRS